MAKDCTKHDTPLKRQHLESIMKEIQENQGGAGRHKCPYCAFEKGFQAGIRHAAETVGDFIQRKSLMNSSDGN